MDKRIITAKDISEVISELEKEFGKEWHTKVAIKVVKDATGEMVVEIHPYEFEKSKEEVKDKQQPVIEEPDLSEFEEKYANPTIEVTISEDKMSAIVSIMPGLKRFLPTVEEVVDALLKAGVKYSIKKEEIEKLVKEDSSESYFRSTVVAWGVLPKPSKDASIKLLFPETGFFKREFEDTEKIDPASVYRIYRCHENQLLAIKEPPVKGENGMTVTGEVIKALQPKDISLKAYLGENVYLSKDENLILSRTPGQPMVMDGKVTVKNVFVVEGDLDYSVGNIDFNGSVIIQGNAEGPFKIKTSGDVLINGVLGELVVECKGSLMVRGGIFGHNKGIIKASKDIVANFINESRIFCDGNILVEDYIMNSLIVCGGSISVSGRGHIVGSIVRARGDISCGEIGSKLGVRTVVAVGINYEMEKKIQQTTIAVSEITQRLKTLEEDYERLSKQLSRTKDPNDSSRLRKSLIEIEQSRIILEKELSKLSHALDVMIDVQRIEGVLSNPVIKLRNVCYSNVTLTIGFENFMFRKQ